MEKTEGARRGGEEGGGEGEEEVEEGTYWSSAHMRTSGSMPANCFVKKEEKKEDNVSDRKPQSIV